MKNFTYFLLLDLIKGILAGIEIGKSSSECHKVRGDVEFYPSDLKKRISSKNVLTPWALCITQSAVSQRVKLLEELTGQVLLARTTPLHSTLPGQKFLKYYLQVKLLEERALIDIRVDDQEQTHRMLKDGEVMGCITRSCPYKGIKSNILDA